jgi:nucleotide-binding universal stress UspA family protein
MMCAVRGSIRITRKDASAMKTLLAVDGSEYTRRMLSYIAAHRASFSGGAQYTVLHTVPAMPNRATAFVGAEALRGYYADEARAVLEPIRELLEGHGIEASYEHRVGHPAGEIASFAEAGNFDLVVMGSHGHNALKSLVLGSVASQVLGACSVPVLIVR